MSNDLVAATHYKTELDYAREVGKMIVKTGKWSKEWNEDTVAVLVLYARDLGIHPVKALMNGFDIIQGKISMKPILMSDMIRKNGHSIQIVQNDATKCILKGKRKDNGDECTIKFDVDDAKKAGLTNKSSFQNWAADMLYNRAMGRLGRMLFSDVIGGAYTDGEMEDIKASTKDVKEPEIMQTDIEVTPTVPEMPRTGLESRTIDGLFVEVLLHEDVSLDQLKEFVEALKEEKGSSEEAIIKSAFSSPEMMERFCKSMMKFLSEPETPDAD